MVSWFNLHLYIPIRDVRKLIYALLGPCERYVARFVHNSNHRFDDSYTFSHHCAQYGYIELLEWGRTRGCEWDEYTLTTAATYGRIHMFKWLFMECVPFNSDMVFLSAAKNGHLDIIIWLYDCGHPSGIASALCVEAAICGHVCILQWAWTRHLFGNRSNVVEKCLLVSAAYGQLNTFIWCMTNSNFPLLSHILYSAEKGGNPEIIKICRAALNATQP